MSKRKKPRDKAAVLAAVDEVIALVKGGSTLRAALAHVHMSDSTWHNNRPKGVLMRRSSGEVDKLALKVHALVSKGVTIHEATRRLGLAGSAYANAVKRLNLSPAGATTGSVRADMLPPRPKVGGKRPPKPVDMNNIESLAKRMSKIDKLLHGVGDLKTERKKIAGRLRSLLKV